MMKKGLWSYNAWWRCYRKASRLLESAWVQPDNQTWSHLEPSAYIYCHQFDSDLIPFTASFVRDLTFSHQVVAPELYLRDWLPSFSRQVTSLRGDGVQIKFWRAYGVGLWKNIWRGCGSFSGHTKLVVGDGYQDKFVAWYMGGGQGCQGWLSYSFWNCMEARDVDGWIKGKIFWLTKMNVSFIRETHDWEFGVFVDFFSICCTSLKSAIKR